MVLILTPIFTGFRVEEEIASEHFVHHAAEGPQIRCFIVTLAQDDLRRSVLSSLNLTRKVVMFPASITQVSDLYPKGGFELVASVEADLAFLHIE